MKLSYKTIEFKFKGVYLFYFKNVKIYNKIIKFFKIILEVSVIE